MQQRSHDGAERERRFEALLAQMQQLDPVSQAEALIDLLRAALELVDRDAEPVRWAGLKAKLGDTLMSSPAGDRTRRQEEAIACYNDALSVFERERFPEPWAWIQTGLGQLYTARAIGERSDNIEQAISHYEQALAVSENPTLSQLEPQIRQSLGVAYMLRTRGERADNVEEALQHFEALVHLYAGEPTGPERALAWASLAGAYVKRLRGERADNLERAIVHGHEALAALDPREKPLLWAEVHNVLGNAYVERISGERVENRELAISHYLQAEQVYTRDAWPLYWAMIQNQLGMALLHRLVGLYAENVEQAIVRHTAALEVYSRERYPAEWAITQTHLGNTYLQRADGVTAENLEQAIRHFRLALEMRTRQNDPEGWATVLANLGNAYARRVYGDKLENLQHSVAQLEAALTVYSRAHMPAIWADLQTNLGSTYLELVRSGQAEAGERGVCHCQQALEVFTEGAFPGDRLRALGVLGELYFHTQRWHDARTGFEQAIAIGERQLASAYTAAGREEVVWRTARFYPLLTFSLLKMGQFDEALVRLEQGKARLLAQTLLLKSVPVDRLSEGQREQLQRAFHSVQCLEQQMDHSSNRPGQRDDRELADRLRRARLDLEQLVASIRAATAADTRPQLDLVEILALAPEGGALVAPVLTPQGSVAFVIPHGVRRVGSEHIVWLEAFTLEDWLRLLRGSFEEGQLGGWLEAYAYRRSKPANWRTALEITGRELWEKLMGPVHERLAELGLGGGAPALLLPQSGLGLLPLHAAWREVDTSRRAFLDDYAVSYGPSAYALSVCRLHTALRQGPQQPSLLIVSNPTADLPFAALETDVVMALFEPASGRLLTAAEATPAAVSSQGSGHRYIHFACHGIYDWDDVMRSRLQLAGENQLTLPDIITGLDLRGVRLVTLSACETSVFKIVGTPDEYVGLPSAFLQAGAPAVVGSLWAVNDLSTALLMREFYRRHLAGGQPIAVALRGAQLWLRDATAQEMALADVWQQIYRTSGQRDAQAFRAMRYYRSHPDERPFAHPEYWAAFTASGAT